MGYCYEHEIEYRGDCPRCVAKQRHEELIEAIGQIGAEETPSYAPTPKYTCSSCSYTELERRTPFCPRCGANLEDKWARLELGEQAQRKRDFFLNDNSIYRCPRCSKDTLKYEQPFCSNCGAQIDASFWNDSRQVREPARRRRERDAILRKRREMSDSAEEFLPALTLIVILPLSIAVTIYSSGGWGFGVLAFILFSAAAGLVVRVGLPRIVHRLPRDT